MNQQSRISDQIYKIQTDRKLIAIYDRLRCAPYSSYAQLHVNGEHKENDHKAYSLIGVTIQDYSNGTGNNNIIVKFNLSPEQIQFFLTRITAGFQEFKWSTEKIFGNPDQNGYSTAQKFVISRHAYASDGQPMKRAWYISISNGKGIKAYNSNGGTYIQKGSYREERAAYIQLEDIELFSLLKRADSFISHWEAIVAPSLINNGKQMLANQQAQWRAQNQAQTQMQNQYQEQYQTQVQYQNQMGQYQNGQYPAQGIPNAA